MKSEYIWDTDKKKKLLKRELRYLGHCEERGHVDRTRKHIKLLGYCAPEVVSYLLRRGWRVEFMTVGAALGNKDVPYYEKEEDIEYNTNSYRDFLI